MAEIVILRTDILNVCDGRRYFLYEKSIGGGS